MCHSPACGNVSSPICGKDTFTGVTKKHCGLDTFRNVPSRICGKDTFTGVAKKLWVGHIYKCVIAQCAEMCLHGYVAKTFY